MKTDLIIKDEVNVRFTDLDAKTRRTCVEKLQFEIPYARYTPQYKLGRWDGLAKFFDIGGRTYLNLLEDVLPIILDNGYEINVVDNREIHDDFSFKEINKDYFKDRGFTWPEGHPAENEPIVLRDYQVEIINRFLEEKQGLQEIPTGAGKTLITAALSELIEDYGRTIVIVPNKSLVEQTEEDYLNLGLDVGVWYGDRKEANHQHMICTWQSLNILGKKTNQNDQLTLVDFIEDVTAVIVDEAHLSKAEVLKKLLSGPFSHIPIRLGLTGTIPKDPWEYNILIGCIGPILHRIQTKDLQDAGVLSNCHVAIKQLVDNVEFPSFQQEYKYLCNKNERLIWLATFISELEGNTLILVKNIEPGKKLTEMLQDLGVDAAFVSGSLKTKDRKQHYDDVREANSKVIIATYGVAAVGINIPRIFNLILFQPGKSFIQTIQSIGRGVRRAEDKDFVQVYDITSTAKYSKRHLTERKKFYKEREYPFDIEKIVI